MADWGLPRFRRDQVLDWVYRRQVADPEVMTNLAKGDRAMIALRLRFITGNVVQHQVATDGVQKLLVDWSPPEAADGAESGVRRIAGRRRGKTCGCAATDPQSPAHGKEKSPALKDLARRPSA